MKILFWNIDKSDKARALLPGLVEQEDAQLVLLAEDHVTHNSAIRTSRGELLRCPAAKQEKISFFSVFKPTQIEPVGDGNRYAIRRIHIPQYEDFTVVAVHGPDPRNNSRDSRNGDLIRLGQTVREVEDRIGHRRTLVVGDMNADPYEAGLLSSEGFHAVMDRMIASGGSRTVHGDKRHFFYNPMWRHYGGGKGGPPATYFYQASESCAQFWHMYDQVLVRPDLLDCYPENSEKVVISIGGTALLNNQGRPDRKVASDHLPLIFELNPRVIETPP